MFHESILTVAILGIVINAIALFIIGRKKHKSMFHDLLIILTVSDIGVVICFSLQFSLPFLWTFYYAVIYPHMVQFLLPIMHITVMISVYSTILLSFERYVRICYHCQLRETSVLTEDNIKYYKLFVIIYPILFYIPKFFEVQSEYKLTDVNVEVNCDKYLYLDELLKSPALRSILSKELSSAEMSKTQKLAQKCKEYLLSEAGSLNQTSQTVASNSQGTLRNITIDKKQSYVVRPTELRKNVYYYKIYYVYLNTTFATLIPLILLLFFNINIAIQVIKMSRLESRALVSSTNFVTLAANQQRCHDDQLHSRPDNVKISAGGEMELRDPNEIMCVEPRPSRSPEGQLPRRNTVQYKVRQGHQDEPSMIVVQQLLPSSQPLASNQMTRRLSRFLPRGRASRSDPRSDIRDKRHELRLARISLCIVWLFIFCHVWKLIPTFYSTFLYQDEDDKLGFNIVWPSWCNIIERMSHSLITINSALNFVIYVVL